VVHLETPSWPSVARADRSCDYTVDRLTGYRDSMPQRDYILRLIEQAAAVLKALRILITKGAADPAEVDRQLRETLGQLGFDLDVARFADAESLERIVAPTGDVEPTRAWLVAETMYIDGLEAEVRGSVEEARLSFEKSLRLYRLFDPRILMPAGAPAALERIAEIEQKLEQTTEGHST